MYKLFRNIGLVVLIVASFIYTERLVSVVKEYDDIMIEIKNNHDNFKIDMTEAIIDDNTIIPGINGKKIDIDKSYTKMREYGKYDESLLVYKKTYPKHRLEDNKDKFIIKSSKKDVAVIILLNKNSNIDDILNSNVKLSFYMDNAWLKNNKEKVIKLVDNNYTILSNNNDYLKNIAGQKQGYCYSEDYSKDILNKCFKNDDYTVVPSIIIKDNYLIKLEKNIEQGSIIAININNYHNAIRYIKNKGYNIVSIEELLDENVSL